ncbi:MAG: hypothetical protein C4330_11220 [Chitinophagaceae bacterium]
MKALYLPQTKHITSSSHPVRWPAKHAEWFGFALIFCGIYPERSKGPNIKAKSGKEKKKNSHTHKFLTAFEITNARNGKE